MKALLTDGRTIQYDRVVKHEESHPKDPSVKVSLYQFSRGALGIVAVVPTRDVKELESA